MKTLQDFLRVGNWNKQFTEELQLATLVTTQLLWESKKQIKKKEQINKKINKNIIIIEYNWIWYPKEMKFRLRDSLHM